MAAMNKAQAQRYKKQRATDYGAEPGEVTRGLKPGDRRYDADTNTWQLKEGASADDDIGGYIDEVMAASGMGAPSVQGSTGGNAGSGSGKGGQSAETRAGNADGEAAVQDALDNGIGLEEIAAGVAGAAAAAVAIKLLQSRKGGKKGAADPAADTAGEADRGGKGAPDAVTGTDVVASNSRAPVGVDDPDGIIDAMYTDITPDQEQLAGPRRQLPAPEAEELPAFNDVIDAYRMGKGTQPAADVQNPELPDEAMMDPAAAQWVEKIKQLSSGNPIDAAMQAVEGPDAPMLDPEMEAALQAYAQQMREQGNFNPSLDPSKNPGLPMMDESVMMRLKSILAGL